MRLYDMDTEAVYTLPELYNDWQDFRKEEPWNHAEDFKTEIFEVLMATVNGRNNLEIVDLVPKEISRLIRRIRKEIEKNDN